MAHLFAPQYYNSVGKPFVPKTRCATGVWNCSGQIATHILCHKMDVVGEEVPCLECGTPYNRPKFGTMGTPEDYKNKGKGKGTSKGKGKGKGEGPTRAAEQGDITKSVVYQALQAKSEALEKACKEAGITVPEPPKEEQPKPTKAEIQKAKEMVASLKSMGETVSERLQKLSETKYEEDKGQNNNNKQRQLDLHAIDIKLKKAQKDLEKKEANYTMWMGYLKNNKLQAAKLQLEVKQLEANKQELLAKDGYSKNSATSDKPPDDMEEGELEQWNAISAAQLLEVQKAEEERQKTFAPRYKALREAVARRLAESKAAQEAAAETEHKGDIKEMDVSAGNALEASTAAEKPPEMEVEGDETKDDSEEESEFEDEVDKAALKEAEDTINADSEMQDSDKNVLKEQLYQEVASKKAKKLAKREAKKAKLAKPVPSIKK